SFALEGSDMSRQSEAKHVSPYSHSDRWVGAGRAWGGSWVRVGEIRWSQGIYHLRCGTASCSHGRFCERVGSRKNCGYGGWRFLRNNPGGKRATPPSHHHSRRGQGLRSHCHVMAWAQWTFHASHRQCDKQGAGLCENPCAGLSVSL